MSNNPNHFNRKMVNPGAFKTEIKSEPVLVFTTRPHQHRPWMNGCTFKMKGKTYKILEGAYDHRGDVVKFAEVSNRPTPIHSMEEKEFFSKVSKQDLNLPK